MKVDESRGIQLSELRWKRKAQEQKIIENDNINQNVKRKENTLNYQQATTTPNVLRLLGQHSSKDCHNKLDLPNESIFYISPQSIFTFVYNIVYILIFYLIQLQLSLIITFGQNFIQTQFINQGFSVFYWFMFGFLIFDIFINLHKGFYVYGKGKVCNDRKKIIINYLKTQIYFDMPAVAFLVIPRVQSNSNVNYLLFVPIILLWTKKFKYVNQIIHILQYRRVPRIVFTLTTLFIDVLLQGHYGACIFALIDLTLWNQQYYGSNTAYYWLSNNNNYAVNLMSGPWYDQYVYAQSFSTGTLSTLAPGPFVKNPIEVCYALFVMIYFMLFASYIGEVLISTLYKEQQKRVFHEQNIQDFDKYMILKNISSSLKTRIYNFFELIWQVQSKLQTQDHRQVIQLLPNSLRQELLVEMSFIKNFFMLKYVHEHKRFEKLLAMKINRTIIDSGTCLFKQATLVKRSVEESGLVLSNIYFLSRGMVKYYVTMNNRESERKNNRNQTFLNFQPEFTSQKSSKNGKKMEQNQKNEIVFSLSNSDKFIGLYEFITKRSLQYCCGAIDLCQLDTISRKDFLQILKITKNEQIFQKIKHKLLAENQISVINKVCSICFESHIEEKCPEMNVRQRFASGIYQEQGNCGRKQQRRKKLIILEENNNSCRPIKSKKIYMKQKPIFEQVQQHSAWSMFDNILGKASINLQEVFFSVTKVDEIEESFIWSQFYPEDNVDRVNYMMFGSRRK